MLRGLPQSLVLPHIPSRISASVPSRWDCLSWNLTVPTYAEAVATDTFGAARADFSLHSTLNHYCYTGEWALDWRSKMLGLRPISAITGMSNCPGFTPSPQHCLSWNLTVPKYAEAIAIVSPPTSHPFPNISISALPAGLPQLKPNVANVRWGGCHSPSFYLTSLPKYQLQCLPDCTASVET
jgi:hypothetical protein